MHVHGQDGRHEWTHHTAAPTSRDALFAMGLEREVAAWSEGMGSFILWVYS